MKKLERLMAGVLTATLVLSAPAAAQTAVDAKAEDDTALREEVKALQERLAKLEQLLNEKLASEETKQTAAATEGSTVAATSAAVRTAAMPVAPTDAEPQEDATVGVASTGSQPLSITGLLDTYYSKNTNNPADGTNGLYYTNPNSRGFGLNQAKITVDAKGDSPVGVHTDVWFGSGARLFRDGLEPGPLEDVLYLEQAYGYYQWNNGAELDVGLFGTIAGLEVAESHLNWNYSRGVLWAWNEPFSHLGAKLSVPLSDTFTGTVMLVNGFDNAFDQNSGKDYGVQGSWAPSDNFNTTLTWISGPENDLTNKGWIKDLSWNFYAGLHPKFEVMANLDYIQATDPTEASATSWGIGGYARYNATDKFKIAQRFEYFDDSEARSTGVENILKEYTLTFEYAPEPHFITRFEYRRDWSTDDTFFFRGFDGYSGDQNTFTVGMMYIFGPTD